MKTILIALLLALSLQADENSFKEQRARQQAADEAFHEQSVKELAETPPPKEKKIKKLQRETLKLYSITGSQRPEWVMNMVRVNLICWHGTKKEDQTDAQRLLTLHELADLMPDLPLHRLTNLLASKFADLYVED